MVERISQDIVTLAVDTFQYNFQRYIFQNKIIIIWYDVNGMCALTCGVQFSLDIQTLAVETYLVIVCNAIFSRIGSLFIWHDVNGMCAVRDQFSLDILTLVVVSPPNILSNAIFAKIR